MHPFSKGWVIFFVGVIVIGILAGVGWAGVGSTPETPGSALRVSAGLAEYKNVTSGLTAKIVHIFLQLMAILAGAKLLGYLVERIGIPGVLGELGAGVILGPYALGRLILIPIHGHWVPLFPLPAALSSAGSFLWPISDELWLVAQLASVLLLFVVGLHTNLGQFLRYAGPASVAAVGGVILPFILGVGATAYLGTSVWYGPLSWYSPQAMFIGAIMVATSVGITARVLSDIKKLDTPEGVTILGAAVIDDVLGIMVLTIVTALSQSQVDSGATVRIGGIIWIIFKAISFWVGLTAIGLLLAHRIERLFGNIHYAGARLGLTLALVLLCAGLSEMFGLAFIIGAYSIGLALSKTKMAYSLMDDIEPINEFIVPIFFAAMGMLVDLSAMGQALGFGLVLCLLAIIGKIVGSGGSALLTGFNLLGASRVGFGMLPRGEVALIMAGGGLSGGFINQSIFGVAILITLVTTILAPILLVWSFQVKDSGVRRELKAEKEKTESVFHSAQISEGMGDLVVPMLLKLAVADGFQISLEQTFENIYLLRKDDQYLSIRLEDDRLTIHATNTSPAEVDNLVAEAERQILEAVDRIYTGPSSEPAGPTDRPQD